MLSLPGFALFSISDKKSRPLGRGSAGQCWGQQGVPANQRGRHHLDQKDQIDQNDHFQ